jgi:hypothetical protein
MWFGSTFQMRRKFMSAMQTCGGTGKAQTFSLFVPRIQKARVDGLLSHRFVIAQTSGKVRLQQPAESCVWTACYTFGLALALSQRTLRTAQRR